MPVFSNSHNRTLFRWWSSWLLFSAFFPIFALYLIWLPLTCAGWLRPIGDVDGLPLYQPLHQQQQQQDAEDDDVGTKILETGSEIVANVRIYATDVTIATVEDTIVPAVSSGHASSSSPFSTNSLHDDNGGGGGGGGVAVVVHSVTVSDDNDNVVVDFVNSFMEPAVERFV